MERYQVKPGKSVKLSDWDPNETSAFDGDKKDAIKAFTKLNEEQEILQELLYVESKHKV